MEILLLTVNKIVNETNDSNTYFLSANDGSSIQYEAGQFITLIIDIDGKEIRRSYSFGSTPGVDPIPFITIKRVENGIVSRFLLRHLKEGSAVKALSAAGRFIVEDNHENNYYFIAAGSGIVPIFSLVKEILFLQPEKKVVLISQNRNEATSIYRKQILKLTKLIKERLTFLEFFSQPLETTHSPKRMNNFLLEELLKTVVKNEEGLFYLCGPQEFMRMVEFTLKVYGVKDEKLKKENFVVGFVPKAPLLDDTTPRNVFIHYRNQTYTIRVAYPHNVLEVALENGIQLPYSCRGGSCSTCTAKCIKGKVLMSINAVLTDKDLKNGLVLTCVAYPETDIELTFE